MLLAISPFFGVGDDTPHGCGSSSITKAVQVNVDIVWEVSVAPGFSTIILRTKALFSIRNMCLCLCQKATAMVRLTADKIGIAQSAFAVDTLSCF